MELEKKITTFPDENEDDDFEIVFTHDNSNFNHNNASPPV
jgi:hypothetical protein